MDDRSWISLVRVLYMPDKLNLHIRLSKRKISARLSRDSDIENSGQEREWYRAKGYMIVVEYINPNFALIAGFCVDQAYRAHYMRKLQNKA